MPGGTFRKPRLGRVDQIGPYMDNVLVPFSSGSYLIYHGMTALQFRTFDGEYVRRLKEGDSAAGDHFASYFGNVLHLKLRMHLRIPDLIEDVTQTTLLRVLQILRQGEGIRNPEKLGPFVNSVCDNVINEVYRAELRYEAWNERGIELPDTRVDLEADLVTENMREVIEEILEALPERDRLILRALFLEEMDKAELCTRYGITQKYLRVLQHRAKLRFREICETRGYATGIRPGRW